MLPVPDREEDWRPLEKSGIPLLPLTVTPPVPLAPPLPVDIPPLLPADPALLEPGSPPEATEPDDEPDPLLDEGMPDDEAIEPLEPLEEDGILGEGSPVEGEPEEDADPLEGIPPDDEELLEDELLDELDDDDGMLGICGMDCDCCC